jgi:hypothetical protein
VFSNIPEYLEHLKSVLDVKDARTTYWGSEWCGWYFFLGRRRRGYA